MYGQYVIQMEVFLAKQVNFHHAEEEHTHCLIAKEFNNSCTTKA